MPIVSNKESIIVIASQLIRIVAIFLGIVFDAFFFILLVVTQTQQQVVRRPINYVKPKEFNSLESFRCLKCEVYP